MIGIIIIGIGIYVLYKSAQTGGKIHDIINNEHKKIARKKETNPTMRAKW